MPCEYPIIRTFRNGAITHVETEFAGTFTVEFDCGEWIVRQTEVGDGPSIVKFRADTRDDAIYWIGA